MEKYAKTAMFPGGYDQIGEILDRRGYDQIGVYMVNCYKNNNPGGVRHKDDKMYTQNGML